MNVDEVKGLESEDLIHGFFERVQKSTNPHESCREMRKLLAFVYCLTEKKCPPMPDYEFCRKEYFRRNKLKGARFADYFMTRPGIEKDIKDYQYELWEDDILPVYQEVVSLLVSKNYLSFKKRLNRSEV